MELREYFRIILKSWWVILPLTGIGLVTALVFSYSQTPIYEATSTYVTTLEGSANNIDTYIFGMDTLAGRASISVTYCEILTSNLVRTRALELAQINPLSVDIQKYEVTCANLPETNVLFLSVQGPSKQGVVRLSEAITAAGLEEANSVYDFFPLRQLDDTTLEDDLVSPKVPQNAVLGAVLGLVIGVVASFLIEYLRSPMERLEQQMIHHPQLGVYNERYFHERYTQEVRRANQRNRPMSVSMVSVIPNEGFDHFPAPAKMRLLRSVALAIQDSVQEPNIVAYLGQWNFGVLLPERTSDEAQRILKNLYNDIRTNNFNADGYIMGFKTVAGLVGISGQEIHYQEILGMALKAVRVAESRGENVYLTRLAPGPFDMDSSAAAPTGQGNLPFDIDDEVLNMDDIDLNVNWLLQDSSRSETSNRNDDGSNSDRLNGDSTSNGER